MALALELPRFPDAQLILAPGDREEWLAARKVAIGGSDVAALKGESSYGTAYMVWEDKTGRSADKEQTKYMRRGQLHERAIAMEFQEDYGITVIEGPGLLRSVRYPHMQATPDFLTEDGGGLEIKYVESYWMAKQLKREAMPASWWWQVVTYLAVTGLPFWRLAAHVVGMDKLWVRTITRDEVERVIDELGPFIEAWWETHVVADQAPEDGDRVYDLPELVDREEIETWEPEALDRDDARMREIARIRKALAGEESEIKKRWTPELGGHKYLTVHGRRVLQRINGKKPYVKWTGED